MKTHGLGGRRRKIVLWKMLYERRMMREGGG